MSFLAIGCSVENIGWSRSISSSGSLLAGLESGLGLESALQSTPSFEFISFVGWINTLQLYKFLVEYFPRYKVD